MPRSELKPKPGATSCQVAAEKKRIPLQKFSTSVSVVIKSNIFSEVNINGICRLGALSFRRHLPEQEAQHRHDKNADVLDFKLRAPLCRNVQTILFYSPKIRKLLPR